MVQRVTGLGNGEFFSLNGQVCITSLRVRRNSEVEATVTNWRSDLSAEMSCGIDLQTISTWQWVGNSEEVGETIMINVAF